MTDPVPPEQCRDMAGQWTGETAETRMARQGLPAEVLDGLRSQE